MVSVLIPTYRRPEHLIRCLRAIEQQIESPGELLVVVRRGDDETFNRVSGWSSSLNIRTVPVEVGGLVAALNAGLDQATGEIIAITDDDAAPRADWLRRITGHLAGDPRVGGVGGRDIVHHAESVEDGARLTVGRVQWFGRVIGNHHLGAGPAREVDVLKGVNMSFRRAAIADMRFDERLRGTGAQVGNDLAIALSVKRRGWKLVYDPQVIVDHYPAQRFDEDRRDSFNAQAVSNAVHNETLILLEHLPTTRRMAFVIWSVLIGTRAAPGLAQSIRLLPRQGATSLASFRATMRGRWDGFLTWRSKSALPTISGH